MTIMDTPLSEGRTEAGTYVLISPVKDEAKHITHTLESVIRQTRPPLAWIIVDDGSSDGTDDIVSAYAATHPYIRLIRHRQAGARQTGSAEVHAFNRGLPHLPPQAELIVKLDGDLGFAPDYFEKLVARFAADPRLGIASGIYLERDGRGDWQPIGMPWYHAFGACKVVRRTCFEAIGGFRSVPGWDTADEIHAMSAGWTTRHFNDLPVRHHKPEGTAMGRLRTAAMHGRIHFVTRGDVLFLAGKTVKRLAAQPIGLNACALAYGYLNAWARQTPRLVSASEGRLYRRLLRARMFSSAAAATASSSGAP